MSTARNDLQTALDASQGAGLTGRALAWGEWLRARLAAMLASVCATQKKEATVSEDQAISNVWAENVKLRDERDRLALDLKKRIWLLHGSRMNHLLYGDDGRMNCNVCFREYAEATIERCYEWEIVDACALVTKAALTQAGGRAE